MASSLSEGLIRELVEQFVLRGYTWRIGGILRPPSVEDMTDALDKADKMLADGECMEMGRLWISKMAGHLDVYMLMGDFYE